MVETVEIPVEWREHVHPRRGGVAGPKVVLDEEAVSRARARERAARPIAQDMAEHERTPPELGKAVRAYLGGDPDPVGAAAVAAIVVRYVEGAGFSGESEAAPDILARWVTDHGLAFAACAMTEASAIELGPVPRPSVPDADGVIRVYAYSGEGPRGWRGEIRRPTAEDHFFSGRWFNADAVAKRLRTLVAAAPEEEYREVVARLAAHRGDPMRRRVASYLVPTETAWMDESLDDPSGPFLDHDHVALSLSSAAQVRRVEHVWATPAVVGTLLDGLGAAALPLLARIFRGGHRDDDRREVLLKALPRIPDQGVFPVLLDQMGEPGVSAALWEAAERFPALAVWALAPLVEEGTTRGLRAAGVVRELLYTRPDVAEALPAGPARALLPRAAVPDGRDLPGLPSVLAGRPGRSAKVDWADPELLPRILTRGGDRALPVNATMRLLGLLAAKSPDVADVREFCDRHSLAEFSWAVFERWYALGAPSRHNWALAQLGLIGDDTTVRRLSPLIRVWPGESATARANAAMDAIAAIGSDVAVTHLFELTRHGKYKGVKKRAAQKIEEIAAARSMSLDALADRAVPDFGLDAQGTLVLDYGPRRFTVTFDQQLAPLVVESNGKVRKSAPKPGPKDDPALAPAAHALFTGLKKDVRTIAVQEIRRLERAMVTRRSWTQEEFRALLVGHPLLGHIVRRLVWITDGGTAFRVAEDHTYADVDDDPCTLAPGARVAVAHPLLLGDDLDTWAELFADYEILQPFEQLGRPVHRLTGGEAAAHRLARVEGLVLPYGKAKGHSEGRWESVNADGEFVGRWLARRDPAGLYVVANLTPGLGYYMYGEGEEQEIEALWAGPAPATMPLKAVPLGEVDPVTMSEAIHDLTRSATPNPH
ncbi:DUF4132 domain-containing protein [Actinomadura litoris]|uniref:DUF4132 domain-containing protein n=1 Tax=Actinomadura litoris TaxID=2678616 RepID=A0A7K1L3S6_9ACTN|nr:DUF4132 domain-containing protein [Actinomadura litoris]MUN39072.1 DUF4132 domain-containing protein [Actinomadura litoris]